MNDALFGPTSIRTRLIVLVLAVTLPIMSVFAWYMHNEAIEARAAAASKVQLLAATTAANLELYLQDHELTLSRIAARPMIRALDANACDPLVAEYVRLKPDFTNLLVRDLNANTLCSFIPNPVNPAQAATFSWFKDGIRRNQFNVGDAFLGRAAGRWVSVLSYPIRDDAGRVSGLLAMPVDLLKLSARLVPAASSKATVMVTVIDRENRILLRSSDAAIWVGQRLPESAIEVIGNRPEGVGTADGIDGVSRLFAFQLIPATGWRVLAGTPEEDVFGTYRNLILRGIAIIGATFLLSLMIAWRIGAAIARPILDLAITAEKVSAGDPSARVRPSGPQEIEAVGSLFNRMLDISSEREMLLLDSDQRWQYALDGSGDGVWDWHIGTGKAIFSKRWKSLLGYTEAEISDDINESRSRIHPDDVATVTAARQAHLDGVTRSYFVEHRMMCRDGSAKWILSRGMVVSRDPEGRPLRMVGTISDLTERKEAEAAAIAAREQTAHVLASISDAFVAFDRDWRYTYVNEQAEQLLGRSRGQLLGKIVWEVLPETANSRFEHECRKVMAERRNVSFEEFYVPLGRWLESHVYPTENGISVFFHDITERKRAESALQSSEERYRSVIAAMAEGVVVRDRDGLIIDCNASAERILGSNLDALRGKRLRNPQWQAFREDGLPLPENERPSHIALATGRANSQQVIGFRRQDGTMLWLSMNTQPLFEPDGSTIRGIVSTFTDVTERRRDQDLRSAKDAAELASRAKSAFLARMSHELRTPLNSILGFAQLLQFDPAVRADDKTQVKVGHILDAGKHLVAMVDEILDLSRIEAGGVSLAPEAVDVDLLIADCVALTLPQADARNIIIDYAAVAAGSWIRGDRTRLRQVLVNLLSNALKYNRQGGSVYISSLAQDDCVEIEVRDTGPGLTAAQIDALYQPFNRLGAEYGATEGTGIGLVIVKQLVEAMAGRIIVSSTIGRGSSFLLVFPRTGAAVAAPAAAPAPAVPLPAHERPATILYVEDNPANVALVRASLALNPNIRLEIAIDGYQGLAAARRLQPDLILLDINLPGMDGFALMQHLRADRTLSMVPCIALSANAMNSEIERAQACGFSDYITKPFDVRALLATIDKHLRRVAPAA